MRVVPCLDGKPRSEEEFVDDPSELLGKPYQVQIKLLKADINKSRFSRGIRVKYRFYKDEDYIQTELVRNTLSPKFNHSHLFSFDRITQDELEFFEQGKLAIHKATSLIHKSGFLFRVGDVLGVWRARGHQTRQH